MVDVIEEMGTCTSDVFEGGDLFEVDLGGFLSRLPEGEIVDVFFEGLALEDGWGLTFPSFLPQVVSFGKVKSSPQAGVEILDNAEILFLNSRCNLEDRTSPKFGIGEGMQRIDDASCGHNLCVFDVRIVGKIGGNSKGNGSEDGSAGSSEEGFLAGSDSGVGIHKLVGIHEGVHGIGG